MAADRGIEESHSMRSAVASPPPGLAPGRARGDGAAIVRIAALKKTFGDLEAIRQMSFDVGDGEFLSVLGPSGCGKSTLLMMIAGLIDPTAGEIRIQDPRCESGWASAGSRRGVPEPGSVALAHGVAKRALSHRVAEAAPSTIPAASDGAAAHGEN